MKRDPLDDPFNDASKPHWPTVVVAFVVAAAVIGLLMWFVG